MQADESTPLKKSTELNDFADVLKEESEFLRRKRSATLAHGSGLGQGLLGRSLGQGLSEGLARLGGGGEPFSVAFSGGGIRAAAFQSGVLWRLAEAGLLKNVEYLAAVSGGGYIASSFVSHCVAEPKQPTETLDSWYLRVVSKSICRMQRNAGGFVRDLERDAFTRPEDGSSLLPRIFDVPLMILCIGVTIITNPLQGLFVFLVPTTEIVQLYFSAAMRAIFCAPDNVSQWTILLEWSPIIMVLRLLEFTVAINFVVWFVWKLVPHPSFHESIDKSHPTPRPLGYLVVRSTLGCLVRLSCALLALLALVIGVPNMQLWMASQAVIVNGHTVTRQQICKAYMSGVSVAAHGDVPPMGCANYYMGKPWYTDSKFMAFADSVPAAASQAGNATAATTGNRAPDEAFLMDLQRKALQNRRSVLSWFFTVVALLLLISAVLMPFDPTLFMNVLTLVGPMLAGLLVMMLVQYRIFGPLTGQGLVYDHLPFDKYGWNKFVLVTLVANLIMVPCYNFCKSIWHWYYLRSLKGNFFAGGNDLRLQDLAKDEVHCPLLLLTGTVNDYSPPGHSSPVVEIFFSPLHTGGEGAGFNRTPEYRTLGKVTALSGAGCLDAGAISMSSAIRFRIWLELLNLCWGDYIIFKSNSHDRYREIMKKLNLRPSVQRALEWLKLRVPSMLVTSVFVAFMSIGWLRAQTTRNADCHDAKWTVFAAVMVVFLSWVASFFGFISGLGRLLFSPLIREVHQVTGFKFQGNRPPGLLYVTDGGVQDCTAIVQLMRRKCGRILLALAASDPTDELAVLRSAMRIAVEEKIGCFFDPANPRRDVQVLLEEFQQKPEMPYLHLGIRYGWIEEGTDTLGELFVVKNRLPPNVAEGPLSQMQPLLTQEEICTGECKASESSFEKDAWGGLRPADLGGLGCCDCCHRKGINHGAKFPHLTGVNYLWLTPQLFNNLSRLGYHASKDVMDKLKA